MTFCSGVESVQMALLARSRYSLIQPLSIMYGLIEVVVDGGLKLFKGTDDVVLVAPPEEV